MSCEFLIKDNLGNTMEGTVKINISDLVLVYINRNCNCMRIPEFEYIFFK